MGTTEYKIFIVLGTVILLVFIGGIITFIFQYHKRKMLHEREKAILNEQHIQDILNTQIEIQEQTMQDIGREIHDNVGQRLTLASIYANQLAQDNTGIPPAAFTRISEIGKIINESLTELRSLSKSLTVLNTDGKELDDMLRNECSRINALAICTTEYEINSTSFVISTTIKNFIIRIIQEFIQNSLRHAHCKHIKLQLYYSEDGLDVKVSDDGSGFDMTRYDADEKKGIGLLNMKKRAELIGADYELQSRPQQGTVLHLYIPVNKLYV